MEGQNVQWTCRVGQVKGHHVWVKSCRVNMFRWTDESIAWGPVLGSTCLTGEHVNMSTCLNGRFRGENVKGEFLSPYLGGQF